MREIIEPTRLNFSSGSDCLRNRCLRRKINENRLYCLFLDYFGIYRSR